MELFLMVFILVISILLVRVLILFPLDLVHLITIPRWLILATLLIGFAWLLGDD